MISVEGVSKFKKMEFNTSLILTHNTDDAKGVYLISTNLKTMFDFCISKEEKALRKIMDMLKEVDGKRYPRKGILLHIPLYSEIFIW